MRIRLDALLVIPILVGLACAGTRDRSGGEFGSRNVLTLRESNAVRASNAYEVVERLKSQWLRTRGTSQMPAAAGTPRFEENPVLVYLDDQRIGTVDQLRRIEIAAVQYIRYYPPAEASSRWGFNHGGGVIFVSTRPLDS